jgi:hypothetical protein
MHRNAKDMPKKIKACSQRNGYGKNILDGRGSRDLDALDEEIPPKIILSGPFIAYLLSSLAMFS